METKKALMFAFTVSRLTHKLTTTKKRKVIQYGKDNHKRKCC